jgi:hypothetical protein
MEKYQPIIINDSSISKKEKINTQLSYAKDEIIKYDYIGIKIATGVATIQDYVEEIAYMQSIRQVIRELEEELKSIQEENEESIDE